MTVLLNHLSRLLFCCSTLSTTSLRLVHLTTVQMQTQMKFIETTF